MDKEWKWSLQSSRKESPEKKIWGFNRIWTHDLRDTGAMLYQQLWSLLGSRSSESSIYTRYIKRDRVNGTINHKEISASNIMLRFNDRMIQTVYTVVRLLQSCDRSGVGCWLNHSFELACPKTLFGTWKLNSKIIPKLLAHKHIPHSHNIYMHILHTVAPKTFIIIIIVFIGRNKLFIQDLKLWPVSH